MKLVVDSNILFIFFWKKSTFTELCNKEELELYTPEYALEEINKYEEEIIEKAKITKKEFNERKLILAQRINFIPLDKYRLHFNAVKYLAKNLIKEEYEEFLSDIAFLSLALELKSPLWTHDQLLKKQNRIPILTTKEIIEIL